MSALLYIYSPIKIKYRLCCTHLLCKLRLSKDKVKFGKYIYIISELLQMTCCLIWKCRQYLLYFLSFLDNQFAKLVVVVTLLLLIYVAVVWSKVFFELARLTRNGLFRIYVFTFFAGELLWASGILAIFGFFLLIASFFIYIAAWVKTDKVGEAKDEGLFMY